MKKEELLNKYIKYNSKITFDIFKLMYQKLIDLGFTSPHKAEYAFKEFSGRYNYFVIKSYSCRLYFNQYASAEKPQSEISVEDLLGYDPFESFELPEKWCIKVNEDNKNTLSKWRTDGHCVVGTYLLSPYHPMDSCSKVKIGYGVPNIPKDTVEITFTQFKQYVLKEPVVTKSSKPFPSRWCIELNKTTIPIVGNYYNKKHLEDPNCVTYTESARGYYVRSHNDKDEYVKNGYTHCSFFGTPSDKYPEITLEEFKQFVMEETTSKTEKDWNKATKEELIEEAKKRYPIGCKFKCLVIKSEYIIEKNIEFRYEGNAIYSYIDNKLYHKHYEDNQWAEIISLPESEIESKKVTPEYVECFYSDSSAFILNKIYKCCTGSTSDSLNLVSETGMKHYLPYEGGLWKFKSSTKEAFEMQTKSLKKWSVGSYIVPLQNKLLTRTEPLIKGKPYRIIKNTGVPYIICEKGVEINFSIDFDTEKNEGIKWFVTLTEAEEFAKTLIAPPKFEVGDIIQANPGGFEYEENGLEQPSAISYLKVDDVITGKCTKITYSQQHRCYWYKIDNYGNMFTEDCITLAEVKSYDLYILNTIYKIEENGKFCLCKYTGMKDSDRMKGYTLSDMNNILEFEYDAVYISGRDVSLASREECNWLELCIKYNKLMDKPSLHQAVHCQTQEEWDFVNLKMKFTAKFGISSCVRYLDNGCISSIEYFKERHLDNYQLLSFQEWCDLNGYKMKKTRFKTGDYVVSLRPEYLSTVSIKFNYCYIQYKDGDKISIDSGTTMYEDDINYARLATPEEIAEYKRVGKPYDVTTLQPSINTYGLNIGDKLDAIIIAAWEKKGFNYFSDPSKGWVFGNGSAYDGNRKIENFKVIDGVVGFLVSGTLKIYLRAEGFKEFAEKFNKSEFSSDKIEETPKFEVGKWYQGKNEDCYGKLTAPIKYNDEFPSSEYINSRGVYCSYGSHFSGEEWTKFARKVPLSEIQQFLPDGHPDKFVKSTEIPMGMKILSSSFYGSPSIKKTKSNREEIYLLPDPD